MSCGWSYYNEFESEQDVSPIEKQFFKDGKFVFEGSFSCEKSGNRVHLSTMPENALRHGSCPPAETGIENDTIEVNHLTVKWSAILAGEDFSCPYSLGTIGLITERPSGKMRISGLDSAGNYQSALLPEEGEKVKVIPVRDLPENYLETQILAWEKMKSHPAWMEHWQDLIVDGAEYDPASGCAVRVQHLRSRSASAVRNPAFAHFCSTGRHAAGGNSSFRRTVGVQTAKFRKTDLEICINPCIP